MDVVDPAARPDELLKQPPPVAVQSPGCVLNVISTEPGARLYFNLTALDYHRSIEHTVELGDDATTYVRVVRVSRMLTDKAMLFFRGTVEYQDSAASRVTLTYDDPRIIPVYTRQLTGKFAGYTEVGLELGHAGTEIITSFTQMYANDDPYVGQAVCEIAQLKSVDWKAILAAPLPPSGRIIDRMFAQPSAKCIRRPIDAECIPTFEANSCACLIVVRDAEPGHDLRFEVQVEPQIVKELFQFKLPEGKSFGSTIWRGGPRSSGSCKLSATVRYSTVPFRAAPVANSNPGMLIKEIQDDCPPAEGCTIWFSIAVPVDPQVPMRYMTAIQSARSDSEEAKAARAQLAAQGGKPFKELLLIPTPPGGWIMGRRPQ